MQMKTNLLVQNWLFLLNVIIFKWAVDKCVIVNADKSSQFLPCLKKVDYLYFTLTMAEFFTVKFRRDLWRKLEIKLPPPLKSVAALPCKNKCLTTQLCSAVNSVQSDTKTCNYGNCSLGMIFLCLNWLLCHVYFAWGKICMFWFVHHQLCIVQCCAKRLSSILHNWKARVMQQTKYHNNIIMTSRSRRKKK